MGTSVSNLIRRTTHRLQTRLVLFTTFMLIISCSTLSWYFVTLQIDSATDTLLRNGERLASQLATTMRYSVYVKDSRRIQELISGALAGDDVSYIFVVTPNDHLLGASGAPIWKQLVGDRMQSDWLPLLAARRTSASRQMPPLTPSTTTIRIIDGYPVTEQNMLSSTQRWVAVLFGSDRPLFYDIVVPIMKASPSLELDSSLGLTFDEPLTDIEPSADRSSPVVGLVQVGLTDRQHQSLLRQLAWQVAIITSIIIAIGIGIVVYIARHMAQPLNALISMARRVASGDLSASVATHPSDEIGELTQVFNQMTTALQSREEQRIESTRTLETKVDERTRELRDANVQLQELDRLKTSLVSTASHELRTPLTSIKVHVTNLLDGVTGALGSDQIESLGRVNTNVDRLRTLIDDLLDLSRLQTGLGAIAQEEVCVNDLMNEVLQELSYFSGPKRISITTAVPTPFPRLYADREKLRRILKNLIHNSIKFTSEGGWVRIEAHQDSADTVAVMVEDSGCGIAPEELDKVFLPFYRSAAHVTQFRGSGLGLSITKELVSLHHGTIWAESLVGKGSRFHLRLPLVQAHHHGTLTPADT